MSIISTPKLYPPLSPKVDPKLPPAFVEDEQSEAGKHISEAVYWQNYYDHPDFSYEWNDGILEVKPMADFSKARMYRWFLRLLEFYLDVYPIAHIIHLEIRLQAESAPQDQRTETRFGLVFTD